MINLSVKIPARTRIRAKILYDLGYLTQSTVDQLSIEQLISLVDTLHLIVNSNCGIKDRKE